MSGAVTKEPMPETGKQEVLPHVIKDLEDRVAYGIKEYGHPLETFNGRDALWDAYQEALDLVMYLRQELLQRKENNK